MVQRVIFALSVLFAFVSGGPADRILGGNTAECGKYPYLATLFYNNTLVCGGFIYNKQYIVTTASCVDGKSASLLKAVLGLCALSDEGVIASIYSIKIYPAYDIVNKTNDIALLETSEEINFTPKVDYVQYDEVDTTDLNATIMGWGQTEVNGPDSYKIHEAAVLIVPPASCSGAQYDPKTMICAAGLNLSGGISTPCAIDYGGPLIQEKTQKAVGIASRSKGCDANADGASYYTRLSSFYSWFISVAGRQPTATSSTSTGPLTEPPTEPTTEETTPGEPAKN